MATDSDFDALIRRLLDENRAKLNMEPRPPLRGMPPAPSWQPMTPSGPSGTPSMLPDPTAAAPAPAPSFMDRLRGGLTTPTTPIRHKNVNSRSFLRGLVGGIKGSGGGDPGGKSSGKAVGADGLTAAQRIGFEYRERADKRADATANRAADSNDRLERTLAATIADRDRRFGAGRDDESWNRQMDQDRLAISRANLAVAQGNLAERRKAAGLGAGGSAKWPPEWKAEHASLIRAAAAADAEARQQASADPESPEYDNSAFLQQVNAINQEFVEREMALTGEVPPTYFRDSKFRGSVKTGSAGSKGPGIKAPQAAPAPTTGVPKKGSW